MLLRVVAAVAITLAAEGAQGAPNLKSISPRGLQIGETTRVTLTGDNFAPDPHVHLDVDGHYSQKIVEATAERIVADVTIGDEIPAGIYPLRVLTREGISNAAVIGIDRLPQRPFAEQLDSLPVALHGDLTGDRILRVQFAGKAEQWIVVDVEGRRLGSSIRPVIRLSDANGRQITSSRPAHRIGGDARIEATLPHDGDYEIELHDVVYKGPSPGWFRLKLGALKFADLAFPLAVSSQSTDEIEFELSNLSTPVRVPAESNSRGTSLRVPWPIGDAKLFTGAPPRVQSSTFGVGEFLESDTSDETVFQTPVGVSGRLLEPGEEDEYILQVKPKSKLRFEIESQRLGSPLDAVLVIATRDGKQLGRSDDQATTRDPGLEVAIPADVTEVVARVSSLIRQHGRHCVYRLKVQSSRPTWNLNTAVDRLNLPSGGRQILMLDVDRGGSKGVLELRLADALRSAIWIENPRLPAEDEIGLISLRAAESTRGVFGLRLNGFDSSSETAEPVVTLRTAAFPGSNYQPHLRDSLTTAVNDPAPVAVAWSDASTAIELARGTRIPLPVQIRRQDGRSGKLRVSLVTTQKPPKKKDGNKEVVDLDRTLRLEEAPILPTDAKSVSLQLLTPVDLPLRSWGFAVKAELLSEDEKQVEATSFTSILRASTIDPLSLTVELPKEISFEIGGDPIEIKGSIRRHAGFDHPAQVTLQGLPKEVKLPVVNLEANEMEFVIPIEFDGDTKTGEFKDVRLVASFVTPDESLQEIRSRSGQVMLKITKAE